jgi:UDP-N-acetylglucosamine 1-carboxyvinyltransferase
MCAGLITGGQVRVFGCSQDRLVTAISTLGRMGVGFDITDEYITAYADDLQPSVVHTATHPGFMTDWQSPLMVLFTQAKGMSVLHETVYEDRLGYVPALREMGAEIELFDSCVGGPACRFYESTIVHSAVVHGVSKLKGAEITIPDIRGGFAYLIAAAIADGESTLHDVNHLERGYHDAFGAFSELGMKIRRG